MSVVYLPLILVSSLMFGAGDTYNRLDIRVAASVQTWYNWGPAPGADGIPMLWNASHISKTLSGDATWLMGFNEPDVVGQANMSPAIAASVWQLVESTYPTRKLVSPSVMSLDWLRQWRDTFFAQTGRYPKMNALGVHWYYMAEGDPLTTFKTKISAAIALADSWGVPEVWVTEWALYPCWDHDSVQFLKDAHSWLKTQPKVTRAFWFQTFMTGDEPWAAGPQCNSSLGKADGMLTIIGQAFRDSVSGQTVNPSWDEPSDLNKDGVTDILDLSRVAAHFGQKKYT